MDPHADPEQLGQIYRLLALCARAEGHPAFYEQLRVQTAAFRHWDVIPVQAELLGIGALLWYHLKQAEAQIPPEIEQTLAGLYLRQRAVNRLHAQALTTALSLLEAQGIHPVLLKGLALAHEYYVDPALRAVNDIDLLLPSTEIAAAADALIDGGYSLLGSVQDLSSPPPAEVRLLAPASPGMRTLVELHHAHVGRLPERGPIRDAELAGLDRADHAVSIDGRLVHVPSPGDTLSYLSRHFARHLFEASTSRPLPLKWVADILALVERHAAQPGWADRLRTDAALMERLRVFYSLTPVPEELSGIIPLRAEAPPAGLNVYPGGWPRERYGAAAGEGFVRYVLSTFSAPSPWWLRLHYGIRELSCRWYAALLHPLYVLQLIARGLIRRAWHGARHVLRLQ